MKILYLLYKNKVRLVVIAWLVATHTGG